MAINGEKRRLGFFGERKAAKFLKKAGYTIVERNFRCDFGEVDIIARKGDVYAFTEVKTRTSDAFGLPNEAVDSRRKARYKKCAGFYFYMKRMRMDDYTVRFDIVEVTPDGTNHIENAFMW